MILLVSATFPPEQVVAAQIAKDLAEYLSDNYKVRVLSPRPSRPLGFRFSSSPLFSERYEHLVLDSFAYPESRMAGRLVEGISFGKHVSEHIKKNHDSIDCCYVSSWPLISQFIIVRSLVKYSIPVVMHIQDIYPESMLYRFPFQGWLVKKILLPIDKFVLRNSTSVIAISQNMSDYIIKTRGISVQKITIVQNWRNEEEFKDVFNTNSVIRQAEFRKESFIFMYMGNIGSVAGVDHLIRSFVSSDIKGAELIIAGCGPAKEKCRKLAQMTENKNISFLDVPEGETASVQKIADVMLLPVRQGAAMSSIPSKLLAYMFSGKPVLACIDAKSDTAKAIEESGCGWVVPPDDTEALSRMMKKVAGELPARLKAYGGKGLDFATKNYSRRYNLPKLAEIVTKAACRET